ncbi:MAG TPA: hypothetical protein VF710_05525 [Longimicrobium sp.]|jgi:hypothetical protein
MEFLTPLRHGGECGDAGGAGLGLGGRMTMVQNLVRASVAGFDRYYPAVMRVVYAGTSPTEAVADAER